MPTTTKMAGRVTAFKVVVFNLFTFSFRVACFSILSDCFGLCDGLSLSSPHTPSALLRRLFHREVFKSWPQSPRRGASVVKPRGKCATSEPCGVQEKLFSRKVRHVVKSFPFFLLSFSPCCHSGSLSAVRREAWRSVGAWVRKRKVQLIHESLGWAFVWYLDVLQTIYKVGFKANVGPTLRSGGVHRLCGGRGEDERGAPLPRAPAHWCLTWADLQVTLINSNYELPREQSCSLRCNFQSEISVISDRATNWWKDTAEVSRNHLHHHWHLHNPMITLIKIQ